ncbi:hypothetical protein CFP56_017598 [Quercus suber]|uniref:Transmembrane protein n=1 Tax=Quercus suber TaxID=58331 RepID=A0AAW0KNZ0_QUESU
MHYVKRAMVGAPVMKNMFMFLGFISINFLEKQTHKKTQEIQLKNEIINLKALIFNHRKIIKSPSHKPRKFKTRKSSNPRSHNPHFFNHQTHIETQNPTTTSNQQLRPLAHHLHHRRLHLHQILHRCERTIHRSHLIGIGIGIVQLLQILNKQLEHIVLHQRVNQNPSWLITLLIVLKHIRICQILKQLNHIDRDIGVIVSKELRSSDEDVELVEVVVEVDFRVGESIELVRV